MNHDIVENLGILVRYYKKIGDKWRAHAYQLAIISIKSLDHQITDIKQVKGRKGVGKGIIDKIKEYLDTGHIRKVDEVKGQLKQKNHMDNKDSILELFQTIWGIGPIKSQELYVNGMRTLDDIRLNQHLLNKNQRIGIKYYKEFLKPIPRKYIIIFKTVVKELLTKEFGVNSFRMKIAGSYRRGATHSGDIDCLVTSKKFNLEQMIDILIKHEIVTDVLSMRVEKFMGVAQCPNSKLLNFRMDVEFLPENEWGSGLLYFTGSKGFNMSMRLDAKKLGYTLNQHGLFDKHGNRVPVFTEKEIMNAIGMDYVEPNHR